MVGGTRTINCGNGRTASCSAGTQHCYDNSEVHCGIPEPEIVMVGGTRTINCGNGRTASCSAGTQHCYDDSEVHCGHLHHHAHNLAEVLIPMEDRVFIEPRIYGGMKTISCSDGSTRQCASSQSYCYDNSLEMCP